MQNIYDLVNMHTIYKRTVRQNSFPLAQRTKEAHMKTRELFFEKKKKKTPQCTMYEEQNRN